uniref:Uncharacterized protein n=1 Tax=Cacopsylla melanoneura TaxID=428564 RepID=A0A8D8RZ89_9HEMI
MEDFRSKSNTFALSSLVCVVAGVALLFVLPGVKLLLEVSALTEFFIICNRKDGLLFWSTPCGNILSDALLSLVQGACVRLFTTSFILSTLISIWSCDPPFCSSAGLISIFLQVCVRGTSYPGTSGA